MERWEHSLTFVSLILVLVAFAFDESKASQEAITGWLKAGPGAQSYSIGTEETRQGMVAYLQSDEPEPLEYAVLVQGFAPNDYLGKRLRLSARVKATGVEDGSGMWMRVDLEKKTVSFDNMMDRPITGSTEWQSYSIVLDVPTKSDMISIGLLLQGEGRISWHSLELEVVGLDVPVTDMISPPQQPINLDFEQ